MKSTRTHAAAALAGLAALAAGTIGFAGSARAVSGPALGAQVDTAVAASQLGLAASTQGARAGVVAPQARGQVTGPATASDRREIRHAVKHSELTSAVDPSDYRVTTIRLSRTDPAWAAAMIRPTVPLDPAAVLAHRVRGHWKVVTLGTAQVGCGQAPAGVLRDFRSYDSIGSCDQLGG